MGNRAVITTRENFENNGVGIYLHWNGGRDSIEAFLKYCELKGYRSPSDDCYGWSCLIMTIGNFFGTGMSIGIDTVNHLDMDNGDNGVYIIDGWKIVDRVFFTGAEQKQYNLLEIVADINECQPKKMQIPSELLTAELIPTSDLKVGDKFFYRDNLRGMWSIMEVIGIGADRVVNGHRVFGLPYMNLYGINCPEDNCNNYIYDEMVYVPKRGE